MQDLVNNYLNTVYNSIKTKPIDAVKPEKYSLLANNYCKNFPYKTNEIKFENSNLVRIPIYLSTFTAK